MLARCNNTNDPDYGGRGIDVCDRWKESFNNFLDDMGERPDGTTIDRFPDQDGNYEPGNCRWATPIEQGRNTRRNRIVEFCGRGMTLAEAAEIAGVEYSTAWRRLDRGLPIDWARK